MSTEGRDGWPVLSVKPLMSHFQPLKTAVRNFQHHSFRPPSSSNKWCLDTTYHQAAALPAMRSPSAASHRHRGWVGGISRSLIGTGAESDDSRPPTEPWHHERRHEEQEGKWDEAWMQPSSDGRQTNPHRQQTILGRSKKKKLVMFRLEIP